MYMNQEKMNEFHRAFEVLKKIKRIESTGLHHAIPHIWTTTYDLRKLVRQRNEREILDQSINVFNEPVYGSCMPTTGTHERRPAR